MPPSRPPKSDSKPYETGGNNNPRKEKSKNITFVKKLWRGIVKLWHATEKFWYALAKSVLPVIIASVPITFSYTSPGDVSGSGNGPIAWAILAPLLGIFGVAAACILAIQEKYRPGKGEFKTCFTIISLALIGLAAGFVGEHLLENPSNFEDARLTFTTGLVAAFAASFLPEFPGNKIRPCHLIEVRNRGEIPLPATRASFATGLIGGFVSARLFYQITRRKSPSEIRINGSLRSSPDSSREVRRQGR